MASQTPVRRPRGLPPPRKSFRTNAVICRTVSLSTRCQSMKCTKSAEGCGMLQSSTIRVTRTGRSLRIQGRGVVLVREILLVLPLWLRRLLRITVAVRGRRWSRREHTGSIVGATDHLTRCKPAGVAGRCSGSARSKLGTKPRRKQKGTQLCRLLTGVGYTPLSGAPSVQRPLGRRYRGELAL